MNILDVSAQETHFTMSPELKEAYYKVSRLELKDGQVLLDRIKQDDPQNMLVYYVENYVDFFTIFINENESEFKELEKNKKERLEMINRGPKESPYYRFAVAEINLQWATARIKFNERFDAAREVYKAYRLLEKNKKLYPDFIENKKSLSIIHALAENLSGFIKFVARIEGSIDLGTEEIIEVTEYSDVHRDFIFREEAYAIYSYILFFQNNKKEEAYRALFNANLDHSKNPLICFLKANIAQKTGRTEEALTILEERPVGNSYLEFPYLDFMYGKFKLYNLDKDALTYMSSFIEDFEGRHFIKEAYQKMAWYELVSNEDIAAYKNYMRLCQQQGYSLVDEDKQALNESKEKEIPNSTLLKARLLFDGGYYAKGYNLLVRKSYLFTSERKNYLEFQYRMGRFAHELKNYSDAIDYYKQAILSGEKNRSYMAANAALQIGSIYESQKKFEEAEYYFERCISIKPKQYKNSLKQKANTGLSRVKESRKNN